MDAQAAQHRQARLVREHQIGQYQQAQTNAARQQFIAAEDDKFGEWLSREMPEYASGAARTRLQNAAHKVLRSTGLSDAQIKQQWDAGYLRPLGFQTTIAMAAAHLDQQERMRSAKNRSREVANQRYRPPAEKNRSSDRAADQTTESSPRTPVSVKKALC